MRRDHMDRSFELAYLDGSSRGMSKPGSILLNLISLRDSSNFFDCRRRGGG